jgi:hypothetical protein
VRSDNFGTRYRVKSLRLTNSSAHLGRFIGALFESSHASAQRAEICISFTLDWARREIYFSYANDSKNFECGFFAELMSSSTTRRWIFIQSLSGWKDGFIPTLRWFSRFGLLISSAALRVSKLTMNSAAYSQDCCCTFTSCDLRVDQIFWHSQPLFSLIDHFFSKKPAVQMQVQPAIPRIASQAEARLVPTLVGGFRVPENLRYHPVDTWALSESPTLVRIGLDDFASKLIG